MSDRNRKQHSLFFITGKKINYRQGTYNATNFVGTEWEKVDGSSRLDIKNLAVGKSLVVATNAGYRVFFRTGENLFQVNILQAYLTLL